MKEFKTVGKTASAEFTEKKSVFIGYTASVSSEDEAREFVQAVKRRHSDARHNCSAFILSNGIMHSSDDGEPSGTAGVPILEVIKKSELQNVVVVVTRYFGGILLGAGGLLRAYSTAARMALEEAGIVQFEKIVECTVHCEYTDYNDVVYRLAQFPTETVDVYYANDVQIIFRISATQFLKLSDEITARFNGKYQLEIKSEMMGTIKPM